MKILLVLPAAKKLRVTRDNQEILPRNMLRFSILPLTIVAGLTPPKHEIEICDENVELLDFEKDIDLVGITFMTALANRAYEIAREFRRRGKIVVGGGYHPTLNPEDAAPHFDAIVKGDAENSWPELLKDIEMDSLKKTYENKTLCDLSEVPVPRRNLNTKTASHYVTVNAVQVGRGCKHGCKYCSVTAFHKKTYRKRPVKKVLKELKQLPNRFMFVDDNIISDPEYAAELFRGMIPMKKKWVSQCSLQIADNPELLDLAHKSGCIGLFIGIETLSKKNLHTVGKDFNDSRGYMQRIKFIRKSGIAIIAGIIVGMDNDDKSVFERTFHFLKKSGIDSIQLNIMTPLPGTPLYDSMKRSGRIIDHNWDHYDFRHCVIEPSLMTGKELQQGADWLYNQFYRLDRIIMRSVKTAITVGLLAAFLNFKLGLTYRFDNINEGITGCNPARAQERKRKDMERKCPKPLREAV